MISGWYFLFKQPCFKPVLSTLRLDILPTEFLKNKYRRLMEQIELLTTDEKNHFNLCSIQEWNTDWTDWTQIKRI